MSELEALSDEKLAERVRHVISSMGNSTTPNAYLGGALDLATELTRRAKIGSTTPGDYAGVRQSLWTARAAMLEEASQHEGQVGYHTDQAMTERTKAARKRDRAEQLRIAAETLGQLDKSGLVLKIEQSQ